MKPNLTVADVEKRAMQRLPAIVSDFVAGGAGDEVTLRENREGFGRLALRPLNLRNVASRDQSATVLGQRIEMPVLLAPAGLARLVHPTGEVAAARAAMLHGTIAVVSSSASTPLERVIRDAPGPHWFQLYLMPERERTLSLLNRAAHAGYAALVLTVDVPTIGLRERDIRNEFSLPFRMRPRLTFDAIRHPRWFGGFLRSGPICYANWSDVATTTPSVRHDIIPRGNPEATLDELRWLRTLWKGRLLVKGLLTAEAAWEAIECGVDGIIVSNHGGRQLDGVRASIDALPEIVSAVGDRAEILVDGGIRRGTDVIKALCLGARAVLIGRPWLYGAALGGEVGVSDVLAIFRREIDVALALLGKSGVGELDLSCITTLHPTCGRRAI